MFRILSDSHQFHTSQQISTVFVRCVGLSTRGFGYRNLRADCVPQLLSSQPRRTDRLWAKLRGGDLTWTQLGTRGLSLGKGAEVEKNRNVFGNVQGFQCGRPRRCNSVLASKC